MKQQTFEQGSQTIKVHTFDETEQCFPFAIVETTTTDEEKETTTFEPVLGNKHVVKEQFKTLKECVEFIESKPYTLILSLICDTIEIKEKWEKEQQELLKHKENETK